MTFHPFKRRTLPFEFLEMNLLESNDTQMLQISEQTGVALNLQEMRKVKEYFLSLRRNPTDIELQTIGQTWSEHCFHKTFKGQIVTPKGRSLVTNMFKTYIAKTAEDLHQPWCLSVFEDNAGIVDFENGYAVAVKVETHNHPSAIEPFGGAATGVGGVIRDVLGVWASPIACTNVLCFGPLDYDNEKIPQGTKHPKYLFRGVIAGIGHYGNNMGIPTVNGAIYFDDGYVGNVVVYCGCVGILPIRNFVRSTKPGDELVLAGGRTGRDGIHGVTFASTELTRKSDEISRLAVQIANPIEEEKLKRAIVEIRDQKLASAITDLGGGGLSCATGEMAHRSRCGVRIELDKVPLKYAGMLPWEIYVSESQERMLLSVTERNVGKVLEIFKDEEVEATSIGRFTKGNMLEAYYHGYAIANLDLDFLFSPPQVRRIAKWKKAAHKEPSFSEPSDLTQELLQILSSPNVASKESVIRTYDHEVMGNTVLKPLQGKFSGPNDGAVIKPLDLSWKGIVISCGMNPSFGKIDPYWMAASAIDEAIRNNVSVGGRRIALLDNFTWGSPEKSDRLGGLIRACEACYDFAVAYGTPFVSGKDSLYNESPLGAVVSSILITAIGIITDVRKAVSVDLKGAGNSIFLVGKTHAELGGSEYYRMKGFLGRTVPRVRRKQARTNMDFVTEAMDSGLIKSCHDLSEGGLAVAAAEMAFAGGYGVELFLSNVPRTKSTDRNDYILFSESNSRFLVEVTEEQRGSFEALAENVSSVFIGRTQATSRFCVYGLKGQVVVDVGIDELKRASLTHLGGSE